MDPLHSTILAVDDNPDNLFVINRLIREYLPGYMVLTARNAEQGFAFALEGSPDCALLDVQMPGTDGIALCKMLKANNTTAGIPVILMTAHKADTDLRVRGLDAGADDFVSKPIDNIELVARIRVALRIKNAEDKLREANASLAKLVAQRTGALRQSQSSFRTVADGLPILLAHVDAEQRYRFANMAFARWFGYDPSDLIGRKVEDVVGDTLYSRIRDKIECALAGRRVSFEHSMLIKDGTTGHFHVQLIPQAAENAKVPGYFLIVQDITEKKNQEQAMLRLATAVERSGEAFLLVDRRHIIQYVNPAYEELTGRSRDEVTNQSVLSLRSDRQDRTVFAEIWETVSRKDTWTGRIVSVKKDGASFEAETTVSPVVDEGGEGCDYVITMRDVSRIAQLEQQVRHMQKMEAIGTLAGGIAHDFNNILAPIIGYTEMAMESLTEESELRQDLGHILKAGYRARDLVRQILTFSRRGEQERRPVRVSGIVKETMKLLRASMPSTIEIRAEIARDAEPCTVLGGPSQIHQLLMNLCTNAGHAMHGKTGLLQVRLIRVEMDGELSPQFPGLADGTYLKLSVEDTGCGIEPSIRERIFDPFFTTKPPGEGTGMGLAVAYGIVANHSGAISVDSEQGKGSTFHVLLPCLESDLESISEPDRPLPVGKENILFVDDEPTLLDLSHRRLSNLGYKVTVQGSATEALRTFREEPGSFDLVITDYTMPQMTGLDLYREIVKIRPEIPVILCSGYSDEINPELAKAAGIRELLMKPVGKRNLAEAVRRVLDQGVGGTGSGGVLLT